MDYVEYDIKKDFLFGSQYAKDIVYSQRHYHNLFELYYLESGKCNYFIENKIYELQPHDIVLIPAGTIHNAIYPGGIHSRMLINCSDDYIPAGISFDGLCLYRCRDTVKDVYSLLKRIEKEYLSGDKFSNVMLRCYTIELFILLARSNIQETHTAGNNTLIEDVIKYIQSNFRQEISLTAAAETFTVSPEHLSRLFSKHTGFGFNEYVNTVRLREAEHMLKNETDKNVLDIAYQCGFNDSNYFSFKFRKAYGMTPSQFRKRL